MILHTMLFSKSVLASHEDPVKCERSFLIDPYFSKEPKKASELSSIFLQIIRGKYDKAQVLIDEQKSKSLSNLNLKALLYTYEATIKYNQSEFENSLNLCDSAIRLFPTSSTHRLLHRAQNYKAKALGALNRYNESTSLLSKVIRSSQKSNDSYNLAAALYYYGSVYSDLGDYRKCLHYLHQSIVIRRKIGDKLGLAASYAFLGLCYSGLDRYQEAIDVIHKSIIIREKLGDKRGLANSYLSMYKVYFELGEIKRAMASEYKSLTICKDIRDLQCVSGRYTNLGELHQKLGEYDKAYYFHSKALFLSKKLKIKNRIALVHENLAKLYLHSRKFDLSKAHLDSSYSLRKEIGDEEGMISVNLTKANIALVTKNLNQAEDASIAALKEASRLGIRSFERDAHKLLSDIGSFKRNYVQAFEHFKDYTRLKDSIFSIDQSKQLLRQELELSFAKKEQRQKEERRRIKESAQKESSYQRKIIWASLISLLFVSGLLLLSLSFYRSKTRSQRKLEQANENLVLVNSELARNKQIIELQHEEITDSLEYARQIQEAVLPKMEDIRSLLPHSFVIYYPKDVISGDFYWVTQLEEKLIIVLADGTGHGVPGGFMTMLGVSMLNELVLEQKCTSPSEILDKLRSKVITSLKQSRNEGEHKDGFDMTICVLDKTSSKLTYASANQTFFIQKSGELRTLKGDHFPVGLHGEELNPFSEYQIDLEKGDFLYLFTDGFSDQFGGMHDKKYKTKNTQSFLSKLDGKHFNERRGALNDEFLRWKGAHPQTDDVTIFGFEIQ
jgi:serine phosphatase RsbU (regulator of sigma subunit)